MLEQRLSNRRPKPLEGLGIVALAALSVIAASALLQRLAPRIGMLSSVLFIAFGCAVAWFLLNWYALGFVYTANADCLRVCRTYGKRERFMADVWLNQVAAWGTPDEMKQRFPHARVMRATRPQCPFDPLAIAYREDGKVRVIVLQPDEQMRKHLLKAIGGRK